MYHFNLHIYIYIYIYMFILPSLITTGVEVVLVVSIASSCWAFWCWEEGDDGDELSALTLSNDNASSKILRAGPSIVLNAFSIKCNRASSNSIYCFGGPLLGGNFANTQAISDFRHLEHGCTPSHFTYSVLDFREVCVCVFVCVCLLGWEIQYNTNKWTKPNTHNFGVNSSLFYSLFTFSRCNPSSPSFFFLFLPNIYPL